MQENEPDDRPKERRFLDVNDPVYQAKKKAALAMRLYRLGDLPGYWQWVEKYRKKLPGLPESFADHKVMLNPHDLNGPHDDLFESHLRGLAEDLATYGVHWDLGVEEDEG
jgi:hypothetical protein